MARSGANLVDVASKAGVSKSTASRVLNNRLGKGFSVSVAVRNRVLDAAKELSYRPNMIAKGLTSGAYQMVSVIGGAHALRDLGNIYQTVVNGITGVMDGEPTKYDVNVDMSRHKPQASELPSWRIGGAVILAKASQATFDDLERDNIPYVVVNGPAGSSGASVRPDDEGGARQAVAHLVDLGHRRIAYADALGTKLTGHRSLSDRHDTFVEEIGRHGLELIEGCDRPLHDPREFVESIVTEHKVTAVVAYGHMEGLNIIQAAHSLGIAVPEQLSLICFCDQYACNVMSPGFTYVDLRAREMGRLAAELLLEKMRTKSSNTQREIVLPEKLVIGKTTGSAPA